MFSTFLCDAYLHNRQLLSVISLLSSEKPNLDSPANVDAAKEVRTEFDGAYFPAPRETNLTPPLSLQEEGSTSGAPKCGGELRLNQPYHTIVVPSHSTHIHVARFNIRYFPFIDVLSLVLCPVPEVSCSAS